MKFDRAECFALSVALRREWLETDGLGGFSSSAIVGLNTRRGRYIAARMKIAGRSEQARRDCLPLLDGLREHLGTAGLGTISEIFDGDAPHSPRGCIAQAWSVAEVLRSAVDDLGLAESGGHVGINEEPPAETGSVTSPDH